MKTWGGGKVGNERHDFETSNTIRFILSEIFRKDHSTEVKEDSKNFIKGSVGGYRQICN